MIRFKQFALAFLSILTITLVSCSNDDDGNNSSESGTSQISVKLMDEPGDYEHVFVEVVDVLVKVNDPSEGDDGWQSLGAINTGIYDLLELTGGLNVLLVDDYTIPSGSLNQIRLVLGDENTIVIDGVSHPLNTPSAQQSGLKIQVNHTLEPNIHYTFLLDFDVDDSIVMAGNSGNINLHPVIRATTEADTGAIAGSVQNDVQVEIVATNGMETVSTFADENGNFVLVGLSGGNYLVNITPDPESLLLPTEIQDVEVVVGSTTQLDPIILE